MDKQFSQENCTTVVSQQFNWDISVYEHDHSVWQLFKISS